MKSMPMHTKAMDKRMKGMQGGGKPACPECMLGRVVKHHSPAELTDEPIMDYASAEAIQKAASRGDLGRIPSKKDVEAAQSSLREQMDDDRDAQGWWDATYGKRKK